MTTRGRWDQGRRLGVKSHRRPPREGPEAAGLGTESAAARPMSLTNTLGRGSHPSPKGNAVSYRSREAKRRKKAAIRATKREHRTTTATRYYLTKVKRPCRCSSCGAKLRMGDDMVYRKDGPVTLCLRDADGDPLVDYRTSLRWERAQATDSRARERRKRNRPVEDAGQAAFGQARRTNRPIGRSARR